MACDALMEYVNHLVIDLGGAIDAEGQDLQGREKDIV